MRKQYPSDRTAELINAMLAAWERIENAPQSPLFTFLPVKARRQARRSAVQLRKGQLQPRHANHHTPEQLAELYERTSERDEILERESAAYVRAGRELRRVAAREGLAAVRTFNAVLLEAEDAAKAEGPDSEAWHRYRRLRFLISVGTRYESDKRRQKVSPSGYVLPFLKNPSLQARYEATAAEILTSPPAGEPVFRIPAEDTGSGNGRVLIRIGIRSAAWIGSFERGSKGPSTVQWMPNEEHLFVSAAGAAYIIDAQSRKVVEKIGDDVVGISRDAAMTLFVVNHNDMSLEAFGPAGRLWKTDTISSGGFRQMAITDDGLVGEARRLPQPGVRPGWAGFSVNLATGEVRFADAP
jgi:hypothetical protein